MRQPVSLRLWLQSASLLAVLVGYAPLLLINHHLAGLQRRQAHEQVIVDVQRNLPDLGLLPPRLPPSGLQVLGVDAQLLPLQPSHPPQLLRDSSGRQWLTSITTTTVAPHTALSLRLRQDVTESVQQEWLSQWLLVAAAGSTSLLTSGLLRLVLLRGLLRPLQRFGDELAGITSRSLGRHHMPPDGQPRELQPIVAAFNALQDRLAASWQRERSFVDGVAHELRTPITLISGRAQGLRRLLPAGPLGHTAEQIQAEADRMGLLVSDLLDIARQDSGRLAVRLQPLDADDALLLLYERMEPLAAGRLQLAGPHPEPLPPLQADPDRLQQCLAALVDNALRYSRGPVQLAAAATADGVLLSVRDHGPGVSADEREAIFERFVRGSASVDTRGSGIGLSVVRLLMVAMGGSVQVADPPGGGADFQLHLPRAVSPAAAPPAT
jgi:two-component system OmpR family sensor kinase